ncbi:Response regulator PleD [Acinetobacter stercoris]|uniref:diguanylate cyclase n=2 Tax=Acinetobacter stercoris TaxID=2126983 RepID=A0A2U3N3Q4_9GAMM|nr:Response regulator PleD [Acinetobacter stercoris]
MAIFTQLHSQKMKVNTRSFIVIGIIIFLCALLGILGRPLSFLATLWVANAVLLGVFLRYPNFLNVGGWLGSFTGYMAADLITGNDFTLTLFLTLANMANVFVSLIIIKSFRLDYTQYNKGLTFLYLFLLNAFGGCLVGALFAVSTIPYVPNTFMQLDRIWTDFGMWWTGEILNIITFLPIILALPSKKIIQQYYKKIKQQPFQIKQVLPLCAVIISVVFAHFFIGPGSIMFPIAALIWASLSYNLFYVTIINCFVVTFLYTSLSAFYIAESSDAYLATAISIRIGLFMLALGPLTLSIISLNRQKLYHQILYLANHDSLTTTLNRRFFYEESERVVASSSNKKIAESISILLLDLDHFKKINDLYGHHIGDFVLQNFTTIVKSNLRNQDLFGRLGGEEFAILLKNLSLQQSIQIAERICDAVYNTPILLENGECISISVSIGLSHQTMPHYVPFQQLINRADHALYQAKEKGRNQLCVDYNLGMI